MNIERDAFLRAYMRAKGEIFVPTSTDLVNSRRAAELCARACVTPERLIAYWRRRALDFVPVMFPSLAMLASPGVAAEAACGALSGPEAASHASVALPSLRRAIGAPAQAWSDSQLRVAFAVATSADPRQAPFISSTLWPAVEAISRILTQSDVALTA